MRSAPLLFASLMLVSAPAAIACDHDHEIDGRGLHFRHPVRWADRHDPDDARIAITTREGGATLLLTDRSVALQLSERAFDKVERKLDRARRDDEDHALARAIRTAVLSSVRALLDHSAECPVRELEDVHYRDGRLILVTEDGDRIFEEIEIDDEEVMSSFSERDARAFVREFRRVKARRG